MGTIQGDLSVLSLPNLVQALVLDGSEGILSVESASDRRVVRVGPAGMRLVRGSPRCHRFERLLRRFSGLSPEGPEEPADRETLLSREGVARLAREWMHEEICELFTWTQGAFVFRKAVPGERLEEGPFADFAGDCDVTEIALEAARWADELPRIKGVIRDLRQVPARAASPVRLANPGLDAEALDDILRLVDGSHSVIQILQLSVFPRNVVLEILYRLTLEGSIRMSAPAAAAAA